MPVGKEAEVTVQELLKLLVNVKGLPIGVAPSTQLDAQPVASPKFNRVPWLDPLSLVSVVSPELEQQGIPLLNL